MRRPCLIALAVCAIALPAAKLRAEVKLPSFISDNMVLQADKPDPIWGTAAAGEKVTVTLDSDSQSAVADASGKWAVKLAAHHADGTEHTLTIAGQNTITIKNVLIGSVWICSGQSNMGFAMQKAQNAATELPKADHPKIHLFFVPYLFTGTPQSACGGKWVVCTPDTARTFTAVGYFFGRDIHEATGQPVGLIQSEWGGTPAQAWTSLSGLKKDAELKEYATVGQRWATGQPEPAEEVAKRQADYKAAKAKWDEEVGKSYKTALQEWEAKTKEAKAASQPAPAKPKPARAEPAAPTTPKFSQNSPTGLYNAMIAPLIPYAIEGAIWYQGESNTVRALEYRTLFARMISDWREKWGQGDFPFIFVQLANFMPRGEAPNQNAPTENNWPLLREAQTRTLALPKTGMAVIIDIGVGNDIHPTDKMDVGHRLALAAEKMVYSKEVPGSSPLYSAMKIEGDRIRVTFKEVGGGLVVGSSPIAPAAAPKPGAETPVLGFSIAGKDHKWVWAQAKIDGDSVVVWSDAVKEPEAVRYAWANNPACNLYSKEGLPASPFRTEEWPLTEQPAPKAAPAK